MREVRIITVPFDPRTGIFDDAPLRAWLQHRELLRAEPHFFEHEGRPGWSVFVEARPLDAGAEVVVPPPREEVTTERRAGREAFARLLDELDEIERARYDALLRWRRETARDEGVPHYVLMSRAASTTTPPTCGRPIATTTTRRTPTTTWASAAPAHGRARRAISTDVAPVQEVR